MQREEVSSELSGRAFEFFFWFSRFEFALKENGFLEQHKPDSDAQPGWKEFEKKYHTGYEPSGNARRLVQLAPKKQVVGRSDTLEWKTITFPPNTPELRKVVQFLKTIRNNLFHGGKHGGEDWDDKPRTAELLSVGKSVLDELATLGAFQSDYEQRY
jgi:hypothetical protein